ncbi:hypothetical protein BpHYR1_031122, partial [Brachionus plicatilis]
MTSDHYLIRTCLSVEHFTMDIQAQDKLDFKKADWNSFRAILSSNQKQPPSKFKKTQCPLLKTQFNQLTSDLRKKLCEYRNQNWLNFIEKMEQRPNNSRCGCPSKPVCSSESSVPSDRPVQPTRPSKPAYTTDLADPSDLTGRP